MHIVIATDANAHYMKQCFVMLYSMLRYNQNVSITLHVLLTLDAKAVFQEKRDYLSNFVWTTNVELRFYEVSRKSIEEKWCRIYNNLPLTTYFRLFIPYLLDWSIDKCIYLDTDLLIRGSLRDFYELELSDDYRVAGVKTNILTQYMSNIDVSDYINAGVLLMNLTQRRKYNLSDQIIQFINKYPRGIHELQPIMWDQCGINAMCFWYIYFVHLKRNCTPFWFNTPMLSEFTWSLGYSGEDIVSAKLNPVILHFAWTRKPCDRVSTHPRKLVYYRYLVSSWLFDFRDLCKFVIHVITYPFCSSFLSYRIIRQLKHSIK